MNPGSSQGSFGTRNAYLRTAFVTSGPESPTDVHKIQRRSAWMGCAASAVLRRCQAEETFQLLAVRLGEARRPVLPLACADLLVVDDPGPGEAAGGLGAVASCMDCRSWSNFLSTSALARATVVWVALMASASKLQP